MQAEARRDKHVMLYSRYKYTDRGLSALCLRGGKAVLNMAMFMALMGGVMMGLAACQTTDIVATDLSCDVFGPITWSKDDSVQTSKQVREHNAAWASLCVKVVNN